jgi:hypothetical protein
MSKFHLIRKFPAKDKIRPSQNQHFIVVAPGDFSDSAFGADVYVANLLAIL